MELLILGGTRFLGRYLVEAALRNGHGVTLFNRGISGPGLFPEVETIKGDRDGDLSSLRGRRWDAAMAVDAECPRQRPPPRAGHGAPGLMGRRERAKMYGGTFSADRRPEGGFRVSARLPYDPSGSEA